MGVYPGATFKDALASRHTNGRMQAYLGVVLHVNDANSTDLFDWIMTGSDAAGSPMSCHFQVTKTGKVYQYLDTRYSSWCQKDGNDTYLSIETQGFASEQATPEQVRAIGGILAWIHGTAHTVIPLQLAEIPGQLGFGWHGMGAAHGFNWGHSECPGVRKDQRAAMLTVAKDILGGDDMASIDSISPAAARAIADAIFSHDTTSTAGGATTVDFERRFANQQEYIIKAATSLDNAVGLLSKILTQLQNPPTPPPA